MAMLTESQHCIYRFLYLWKVLTTKYCFPGLLFTRGLYNCACACMFDSKRERGAREREKEREKERNRVGERKINRSKRANIREKNILDFQYKLSEHIFYERP